MQSLPFDMIRLICLFVKNINLLNTCTAYRKGMTIGVLFDYLVEFGYDVKMCKYSTKWYLDGFLHRINGPAIENINGNKSWYKNGVLHRLNGPAVENQEGKWWYQNGVLHRKNGPSVITLGGTKEWYRHGDLHNVNGPAIMRPDGTLEWFVDGKRHRIGGPAVISPGKKPLFFVDGYPVSRPNFSFPTKNSLRF